MGDMYAILQPGKTCQVHQFVAGAAVMGLEIMASRLLAKLRGHRVCVGEPHRSDNGDTCRGVQEGA
jgi:hypothetical protein